MAKTSVLSSGSFHTGEGLLAPEPHALNASCVLFKKPLPAQEMVDSCVS